MLICKKDIIPYCIFSIIFIALFANNTISAMPLKYQNRIDQFGLDIECPTEAIDELGVEVYRWSFDPIEDAKNFLPNVVFDELINNPYPYHKANSIDKCKRCGASFFTNISTAKSVWSSLSDKNKENFGYTHIASGILNPADGVITKPAKNGHFGFYENEDTDLAKKFTIHSAINNVGD